MSDPLFQKLEAVKDEDTFVVFAEALQADRAIFENEPVSPDGFQGEWANTDIVGFLGGAVAWAQDSAFGVRPGPKPSNPWQLFARFLWAGRGYE